MLAQLITNDSIQTNQLVDKINSYITSPVINAALVRQSAEECVIEGTEVLTSEGFKDFRDLTLKDKVANYTYTGEVFFNYPRNIIKKEYNGIMYKFSMHNYEQIVTPGHRMVKRVPNGPSRHKEDEVYTIKIEEARDCSVHNYDLPIAGAHTYGENIVFTPLDALAVAFQADGSYVNGKKTPTKDGYSYRYYIKRKDKVNRLHLLVTLAKCRYTITGPNSRGYTTFYIWTDRFFDKTFDWVKLDKINSLWGMMFLEELKYWDGCDRWATNERNSITYTNTNIKAINKVQEVAAISSCQTGLLEYEPNGKGKNKIKWYQLHIVMGKDYKTGRDVKKTEIQYNGMVYCCTVLTGMIICRYKNNVFVTGNCLHSESYSIMAEDICQDSNRIYNMHFEDNELYLKNKAVESMYLSLYDGNDPSKEDILLCFVANQILEELVFPGGFVVMYSLGNKMVGSAEMIREINKDESLSHVPLFAFIFKQAVNEEFDGHIPNVVKDKARDMIIKMTDAEKRWTKYASKGLLGFSDRSIDIFIESRANSVCKNLGLELIYKEEKVNPLGELLKRNLRGETDSRQNFFEANVTEYSKTGYVNDL